MSQLKIGFSQSRSNQNVIHTKLSTYHHPHMQCSISCAFLRDHVLHAPIPGVVHAALKLFSSPLPKFPVYCSSCSYLNRTRYSRNKLNPVARRFSTVPRPPHAPPAPHAAATELFTDVDYALIIVSIMTLIRAREGAQCATTPGTALHAITRAKSCKPSRFSAFLQPGTRQYFGGVR